MTLFLAGVFVGAVAAVGLEVLAAKKQPAWFDKAVGWFK